MLKFTLGWKPWFWFFVVLFVIVVTPMAFHSELIQYICCCTLIALSLVAVDKIGKRERETAERIQSLQKANDLLAEKLADAQEDVAYWRKVAADEIIESDFPK